MNQIRLVAKTKSVRSIFTIARPRQLITPLVVASARPCHGFLPLHQRNTVYSLNPITSQRYFSSTVLRGNDDHENYIYEDDWIEWFAGVEYQSASLGFDALDNVKLDRSSRFLIQQLQDLYHGIVRQYDRPTTEQCNKILNDLLQYTTENNVSVEEYAFRADAILQCMQLFLNILPSQANTRLPYPLPLPNRDSYVTVLTLFSKTRRLAALQGPIRALNIVESMEQQSNQVGDLSLQPIPHDYNKVLLAWGTSKSPRKAYYSANLLLKLKRDGLCDDLSYTHVLRACAFSKYDNKRQDVSHDFAVAQELAAQVALKVYGDMVKNNVKCNNATYSYFLRTCTFLENERQRDSLVEEAFLKCRKEGLVDDTILLRLQDAASPRLWNQLMGRVMASDSGDGAIPKARHLPPDWTRHAR